MNVSLYQAAASLDATARWQEMIASNLASSSIPGFKKQEMSFAAVQAGLIPAPQPTPGAARGAYVVPHTHSAVSFAQGELKYTGTPTDLAIEGPAFFQVQMPDGTLAHTRDGEFRINAQGQLVTKLGYLVMSAAGPLQLDLSSGAPITISPTGEVSQGAEFRGQLQLVEFENPQLLTPAGAGLFLAQAPELISNPAAGSNVRQGFIESANTSPALEMASLLTAMRLFEANQRIVQMQDERIGKLISDLGQPV